MDGHLIEFGKKIKCFYVTIYVNHPKVEILKAAKKALRSLNRR